MRLVPILTLALLTIAMGAIAARLVRGPTTADRVVALDVLAAVAIGFIATYAAATGATALLDAALVLALVSFVGTVAFARYLEHRPTDPHP
jgi:multicomponent Na+:H+ antiporter subunit F